MVLTRFAFFMVVAPIAEATQAMEPLLDPYMGKEHAKRGLVVRDACLNWAYSDPTICLAERPDLDKGWRKHAYVPKCDGTGPIVATPLCAIGSSGTGGPSCVREDVTERSTKRVVEGTQSGWSAFSSSASSGDRGHPLWRALHRRQPGVP